MKALIVNRSEDQLSLSITNKPTPEAEPDECLVKLHAAALNRRDYWISVGKYPGILDGTTLGSDGCGEVVSGDKSWIGKMVLINPNINWGHDPAVQSKGYSILGTPDDGTLAEYLVVPSHRLVEKPDHLSNTEAAAIPLAGLTAYRAVFTKAQVQAGQKVLVTGIGGGVAQFASAFIQASGGEVHVTSGSAEKLSKAFSLGAVQGFNYQNPDWVSEALRHGKYDAIIDSAGGNAINDYLRLVKPGGKIVVYGSTTGKPEHLDLFRLFWSQATIEGSTMGNDKEFHEMIQFVRKHKIRPVINKVWTFDQGIAAIESMAATYQFGKVVIKID